MNEEYLERISKQLDNLAIDQIPIGIKELQQENKRLTHTNKSYKGIINKQNKIIDEMALAIASYDIDEEICKNQVKVFCDNEPLGVTADVCAKCIKKYFEKKVEEN